MNLNRPVYYKMYPSVPPSKKTKVQNGITQFFSLLKSSLTNKYAVRESNRPYQSEPADTGLASLMT